MELRSTVERFTKLGRKSLKRPEPENTEYMERLQSAYPTMEFVICDVCGNWAKVWPEDEYFGMHPMGCASSATGVKIARAKRRAKEASANLALF
jgi:hypothetical protein